MTFWLYNVQKEIITLLYLTNPKRNTPYNSSCMATHYSSQKPSKKDEQDVGHCCRSKNKFFSNVFYALLHMDGLVLAEQQELIYTNPVQTL